MAASPTCSITVDLTGRSPEEYATTLDGAAEQLQGGHELTVITDASDASLAIASWCRQRQHRLSSASAIGGVYRSQILIQ